MSSLIPKEKLFPPLNFNMAPMIDFLFLMLAFFATLAVTRAAIFDTKLELVKLQKEDNKESIYYNEDFYQINLSITKNGDYNWVTEIQDYPMESLEKIQNELQHQYNIGLLPKDRSKTQVLLHIDKRANWEKIAKLIFAIRELGFEAYPIYESAD